MFKMFTP